MTDLAPEAREAPDAVSTTLIDHTILGTLRAQRAQIGAGANPLHLEVPGYDGRLVVAYKWTEPRALSRTAKQLSQIKEPTEQMVAASADTLVAACEEVFVRVEENGNLVLKPLSTDGHPVTFSDPRLAYALGFEDPRNARDMAIRAFNNEYALMRQAGAVVEWLEDTTRKVNEDFLGE